jgi:hypothetical protein
MCIKAAFSEKSTVEDAVMDIKSQLNSMKPRMVIFFSSSYFDKDKVSSLMKENFNSSDVFGCTTSGELISGKMLNNSIVAMALSSNVIDDVKIEIIENVNDRNEVKKVFSKFDKYYGEPILKSNYLKYLGIVLTDGLSKSEEVLMDVIGDLTNNLFVGGSAGDDLKFEKTYIFVNGKTFNNAAAVALIKPGCSFDVIKTQSFKVIDKKLTATKVDEKNREVIEFNNIPAVKAYAQAIGVTEDKVANYFMSNPVGIVIDEEIFVRSPQKIKGNSILFFCNIIEGTEVCLLKSQNIVEDTKKSINNKVKELGGISGIINFHCILRTLELEQKNQTIDYGKIFSDIPTIGFSTYGEEYLGHMNQTSTMLVFKCNNCTSSDK